jgi:CxxC motif-containing protein (DUF1111 family)
MRAIFTSLAPFLHHLTIELDSARTFPAVEKTAGMVFTWAAHLQSTPTRPTEVERETSTPKLQQEGNMRTTHLLVSAFLLAGCLPGTVGKGNSVGDESSRITSDIAPLSISSKVKDPGPRAGSAGAGGPFDGLSGDEQTFFRAAREVFREIDSVSGKIEPGSGLGPTFNGNSCAGCHAQPDVGGSSPHPTLGQVRAPNPQIALATLDRIAGGEQAVPSFITVDGPVREARFVRNADGSLDGGVHGLYTIAGRSDAPGCALAPPDFATELGNKNVIFRIPTPTFGGGLLEAVPDDTLVANLALDGDAKAALGIAGALNRSGNDGSVTRFGWKAQNKSLLIFAGEAYNVEQGVSNELFANERATAPGCQFNAGPEDATDTTTGGAADTVHFAAFMRLSAAPAPTTRSASELRGAALFGTGDDPGIGCVHCHSDTLTTGASRFGGMSNRAIHPYSDLALHHMGPGLADLVRQGGASGDQFRSAPLWGVGQRIFFLHDGRATPQNGGLVTAILQHRSRNSRCTDAMAASTGVACCSEANQVIESFAQLPAADQQAILDFLRSL